MASVWREVAETWGYDWTGKVMVSLMALVLLTTAIAAIAFVYEWQDFSGVPWMSIGNGTVVRKKYRPAYSTTAIVPVGKVMIPQMQRYPASYKLLVECADG